MHVNNNEANICTQPMSLSNHKLEDLESKTCSDLSNNDNDSTSTCAGKLPWNSKSKHHRRSFIGGMFNNTSEDLLKESTMHETTTSAQLSEDEVLMMDSDFTFLSISERRRRKLSIHEDEPQEQNNRKSFILLTCRQSENDAENHRRLSFMGKRRSKKGMPKSPSVGELSSYVTKQKKLLIDSLSEECMPKKASLIEHQPRKSLLGRRLSNTQHSINIQIDLNNNITSAERDAALVAKMLGDLSDDDDDDQDIDLPNYSAHKLEENAGMDDSNAFVQELVEKLKAEGSAIDHDDYNAIKKCQGHVFYNHDDDDDDDTVEEKDDWKITDLFRNKKEEREHEIELSLCI